MRLAQTDARAEMNDAEWETRCELAALYRIVDKLGWTDHINAHATARIPGEPDHFLINAFGETFDEVTASSLVKMDMDGNTLSPGSRTNKFGYAIHSGVYQARPDANCVIHTHTPHGSGISLIRDGLRPISQASLHVLDDLAYHAYGKPGSKEESRDLGVACRKGSMIILYNHGLLTHAPTIMGALYRLYLLEEACALELTARSLGAEPIMIEDDVVQDVQKWVQNRRAQPEEYGKLEWDAHMRALDRSGADYRR